MKKNAEDFSKHINPAGGSDSVGKVSSFAASRMLKQAEGDVEAVRRRIQMLKIMEEKNLRKIEEE
jgi:hypothetical protein